VIPQHVLSTTNIPGYYLTPDNSDPSPVVDYELGGVDLNDTSQGLNVKVWKVRLHYSASKLAGGIYLSAPDIPEFLFYAGKDITEVSFTFDQNMNPFLAFMQNGQAKFYWFDPTIPGYTLTLLPAGSVSPKVCLDDKRAVENPTSDVILGYIRSGTLYYREQRDRFLVEYTLKTGVIGDVLMVGMTKIGRLQFALGLQDFPTTTNSYRYATGFRRRIVVGGGARRIPGVNYGG